MDLQRRAELYYQQNGLAIKLWHQSFQRLDQLALPTYSRSPQLDLTYQRRLSRFWNVRALGSWVQFKRTADDFFAPFPEQIQQLEQNQGLYGERLHMQPELSYQRRWPGAFVAGAAGIKYTQYSLQQDTLAAESWVGDSSPNRQVGYFHVDAGLYFDREFQSGSRSWLHTLEPRALYLRQGYSDQSALPLFDTTTMLLGYNQLFRKERFVGLDRVGDANQLTLGDQHPSIISTKRTKSSAAIAWVKLFTRKNTGLVYGVICCQGSRPPARSWPANSVCVLGHVGSWKVSRFGTMRLRDGRNWVLLCIIALISAGCSVWVRASARIRRIPGRSSGASGVLRYLACI